MLLLLIVIILGVFLGNMLFKTETDKPGTVAAAVLKFRYGLKYAIAYPIVFFATLFVIGGFIQGTYQLITH